MLAFLTSKWGLIFIAVALTVIGFIWWTLHAEAAGAAAVVAAVAAKAAQARKEAADARDRALSSDDPRGELRREFSRPDDK